MEQTFDFSQADPLFVEVAKYVVKTGKAQASALQRDFELGFNRADRIISQVEVERNEEYSIFEYRLCPSFDFRQKILSMGATTEVLVPAKLIAKVRAEGIAKSAQQNEEYKFKVYKK